MSNYRRGYYLEQRVSAALRDDGYWTVESRGSHGAADVVAIKPGQLLLVQCKAANPLLPPAERVKLLAVAAQTGGVPLVAFRATPRRLGFRRLTGPGPKDFTDWRADEVA